MSAIYEKDDETVGALLDSVMRQYHPNLKKIGLTVDILLADNKTDRDGEIIGDGFPVKANGYPALASVKIISAKDRVAGRADIELVIDNSRWDSLPDATQIALLDHELTHIQRDVDDGGSQKFDDAGRPKLLMRKHDHQFGWFNDVAERHGAASLEVRQIQELTNPKSAEGQMWFDFINEKAAMAA